MLLNEIQKQIDAHNIVSFDIFDTLLLRPYVKPTDLFLHLEKLENADGFAKARIEAQNRAYNSMQSNKEDITIDEIYDEIAGEYKNLKLKEMDLEYEVLRVNPEMKEVYDYALKQGKRIIIVSDMYLPEKFLSKVLKKNGYKGFEKIYVSGDRKKRKGTGELYKFVTKELLGEENNILHIGDNKNSDYNVAQREGIDSFWYEQVIQRYLRQNEKAKMFLEKYPNNLEVSVMIMAFALHWLENPNEEFWARIGYEYGGPMVYAYMRWVEEQVLKEGIKEILFVARDGYSLQKVFDSFGHKDIKTHYIYAPRQVFINCNIEQAMNDGREIFLLREYQKKNEFIEQAAKYIRNKSEAHAFINDNIKLFIDIEKKEKENYAKYIDSFSIGNNACIIDTRSSLLSSTKLISYFLKYKVKTFLYSAYKNALNHDGYKVEAFSYDLIKNDKILCWDFYEYMMTSPEPPLCGVVDDKPVYKEITEEESKREKRYFYILAGILDYAQNVNNFNFFSCEIVKEWADILFINPNNIEKSILSQVKIAGDEAHETYRPLYDFSRNEKGFKTTNKNVAKYAVLGIPLLKIKSTNYYSFKFNDNCVKNKIIVLGLPLFKSIVSSWFYKLTFCGLPLVCTKSTNTKKSLHLLGFPLYKITGNFKKVSHPKENAVNLNLLTGYDFCKIMVNNNRIMERKLSTFALHQKTFPQFKGINKGKNVVIVATGPTLSEFKPIKNAVYIGVNRAIQFNKVHYDYYFIQDFSGATPNYIEDVYNYKNCTKFMGLTSEDIEPQRTIPEMYGEGEDIFRYRTDWEHLPLFETKFSYDLSTTALGCGGTVVLPALQFALWTHPKRIYLVGCDTTTSGYFDNKKINGNFLVPNELVKKYREFANFAQQYYPDVEIISINPVGLKGIFNDEYQTKAV